MVVALVVQVWLQFSLDKYMPEKEQLIHFKDQSLAFGHSQAETINTKMSAAQDSFFVHVAKTQKKLRDNVERQCGIEPDTLKLNQEVYSLQEQLRQLQLEKELKQIELEKATRKIDQYSLENKVLLQKLETQNTRGGMKEQVNVRALLSQSLLILNALIDQLPVEQQVGLRIGNFWNLEWNDQIRTVASNTVVSNDMLRQVESRRGDRLSSQSRQIVNTLLVLMDRQQPVQSALSDDQKLTRLRQKCMIRAYFSDFNEAARPAVESFMIQLFSVEDPEQVKHYCQKTINV